MPEDLRREPRNEVPQCSCAVLCPVLHVASCALNAPSNSVVMQQLRACPSLLAAAAPAAAAPSAAPACAAAPPTAAAAPAAAPLGRRAVLECDVQPLVLHGLELQQG